MILILSSHPELHKQTTIPVIQSLHANCLSLELNGLSQDFLSQAHVLFFDFSFSEKISVPDQIASFRGSVIFSVPKLKIHQLKPIIEKLHLDTHLLFHPYSSDELIITVQEALKSFQLKQENKNLWQDRLIDSQFSQLGELSTMILHDLIGDLNRLQPSFKSLKPQEQDSFQSLQESLITFREFSRIRMLPREPMWVNALLKPYLKHWKALCFRNEISFTYEVHNDFEVTLHTLELGHIVNIAIKNSIRAVTTSKIKEIKLCVEEPEIRINDSGIGFANLNLLEQEPKGSGLGLMLSKRLLNNNNAQLIISNSENGAVVSMRWDQHEHSHC